MKAVLAALLVALLLAFGCIFEQNEEQPSQMQNISQEKMPSDVQNAEKTGKAEELAAVMPQEEESSKLCVVEFQRESDAPYRVVVKAFAEGEITVICPDGEAAKKSGNVFFCQNLAGGITAAYIDGKFCGSAEFGKNEQKGSGKASCFITLPRGAVKGESFAISINAYAGDAQATLSYDCGEETKSAKVTGIYSETAFCSYREPGAKVVAAWLDGKQCASAKINIYPTKRECSVQREPMKVSYENGTNTYTGMVYAHGYNEKDELAYRCFGQPYRIKLGSIPGFSDFEYEIKCQSSSKLAEPVRVSIGNEECGLLFPPN